MRQACPTCATCACLVTIAQIQCGLMICCYEGVSDASARGMGALYSHVLQPDRNIRMPFLKAVLRCFDTASDLLTMGAATANLRQALLPTVFGAKSCICPDSLKMLVLQKSCVMASVSWPIQLAICQCVVVNSTCSCDQAALASIKAMWLLTWQHWVPCWNVAVLKTFLQASVVTPGVSTCLVCDIATLPCHKCM